MPVCVFGCVVDVDGEFSPVTSKSSISDLETSESALSSDGDGACRTNTEYGNFPGYFNELWSP